MTSPYHRVLAGVLALAPSLPAAAQAQEAAIRQDIAAQEAPAAAEPAFTAEPIADDTLQATAGREDIALIAQADQAATVSKNSVGNNSVTGGVRIADSAFQNLSGLSVLNVNTGNNVAINASMNVNISINPMP